MATFVKYGAYGLMGLALRLAFPELPVDWMLITIAFAFFARGLRFSLVLLAVLSLFYSAFSSLPWWQWVLPALLGLLAYLPLRNNLSLQGRWGLVWLTAQLWVVDYLFWNGYTLASGFGGFGDPRDWIGLPVTVATGVILLPLLANGWAHLRRRLPGPRSGMKELPQWTASGKKTPSLGTVRKPFGFEKGF